MVATNGRWRSPELPASEWLTQVRAPDEDLTPPYDLAERLRDAVRDADYLVRTARTARRLMRLWGERAQCYERALLEVVHAADRGVSLESSLRQARALIALDGPRHRPPTRDVLRRRLADSKLS